MKLHGKRIGLFFFALLTGTVVVSADQTDELLNIMDQAMLEPCNSKPYMACLGLEQAFCRKQVGISVKLCHKKYPIKYAKDNKQQFFKVFGACMQSEIISRLKLDNAMLAKCEPVLKANLPKG